MESIKGAFGEFNKFNIKFCLSYDLLNWILSPSKFVYFNENLDCCHGRPHDVTCSRRKCYVTCGHIIINDMTLSPEKQKRHMIKLDITCGSSADLQADDSHEISSLDFLKLKKYATHLLSVAVKIGTLRVNNLCFVTIK